MTQDPPRTWLSIDEAARRVGVSRLRLREAIAAGLCEARRDNRGSWRVALAADPASLKERVEATRAAPDALIGLLFDEIEDVNLLVADRDESMARLNALAARQQEVIERALSLAQSAEATPDTARLAAVEDRSARLIETALAQLAARDEEVVKLTGLLDRAFATISALEGEVNRHAGVAERQRSLLDRLFSLASASLDRFSLAEPRGGGFLTRLRGRLARQRGLGTRA
jgi:hypothetical protein